MKIATWNVNSLNIRLPQVLDWLSHQAVDVLCLQELKLTDDKFPTVAFVQAGYHCTVFGQKTYNGVAVISKTPCTEVVRNLPALPDEQARVLSVSVADPQGTPQSAPIRIVNGYFVNGQDPLSDKFQYKMQWLHAMQQHIQQELQQHPQLVLLGDFNITADDRDTWDPEGLRNTIHHTREERDAFQRLLDLDLCDAFRLFEQAPKSYSWWDYRDLAFRRNRGLRIDYILLSAALRNRAQSCVIDKTPRKNERPSDHTPVVVELK